MTDHDAARLAEIRANHNGEDAGCTDECPMVFLLRLLDAAARPHDAEFVTRATYDKLVSFIRVLGEGTAAAGLPAGDRTVVLANVRELIAACARHVTAYDEVARRVAELEAPMTETRLLTINEALSRCADRLAVITAERDRLVAELTRAREALRAVRLVCIEHFTGADEGNPLLEALNAALDRAAPGEEPADGDTNA